MKIREELEKASADLIKRLEGLEKKAVADILPFVNLPDFTDHGVKHSKILEDILAKLIPQNMIEPLTPFEIFSLLTASLLHDIGMFVKKVPDESVTEIRVDHYNRSREFVLSNKDALGLSRHEAIVIGEICRAHGMPNLSYLEEEDSEIISLDNYGKIRISLLSALLRVADILEITTNRAPEIILKNRAMSPISREYWELHSCISSVEIHTEPSWDIIITALPETADQQRRLHRLVNAINDEVRAVSPVLRAAGIFFKQADLHLSTLALRESQHSLKNPFLQLAPFELRHADRFAGRDKEIEQVIERILGRKLVVVMGESGVGKTSLIEAGVVPPLKQYKFGIAHFSFQKNPLKNLVKAINNFYQKRQKNKAVSPKYTLNKDFLVTIEELIQHTKKGIDRLLVIGDHLEQMFTVDIAEQEKKDFISGFSRILGRLSPHYVSFLFCIRQDYLPYLYDLSREIPELYEQANTFKLHRLSRENGKQVFLKASECARTKLTNALIENILDDLCELGEGMIYPPSCQIVGYRLYTTINRYPNEYDVMPEEVYTGLGSAEKIINQYFDSLLDNYSQEDRPMVGQILQAMVTDYYTKKRVTKEFLQNHLPNCTNLEELLGRLINQRIVRRTLDEYELIHDSLALKVIELIRKQVFLTRPVRAALEYIEKNYHDTELTVEKIGNAAGVTRTHLATLFRDQLNKTINNKLNQIRIAAAKRLLGSNREPIAEIANAAGFKSLSSFSRKFKEIEGQSPLQYRQQIMA